MRILITGAWGQLGREVSDRAGAAGMVVVPTDVADLDITDRNAVRAALEESGAGVVVNAAAYTAVDLAESEPDRAMMINRDGPAVLAGACAQFGLPLIHVSTDYVFDGEKTGAYMEDDPTATPLGVYGRTKAEGEAEIRRRLAEHVIIRTAWLYGVSGGNFVKTMLRLGRDNETLRVVSDQRGCPTYAADLAEAVLAVIRRLTEGDPPVWGTYHFCGSGATTWHGFAERIFDLARGRFSLKVKSVQPITTAEYPTPARRPANSVLDCSRFARSFGYEPPAWEDGLARMLTDLARSAEFAS